MWIDFLPASVGRYDAEFPHNTKSPIAKKGSAIAHAEGDL